MPHRRKNEPPVLDVERELALMERAGVPFKAVLDEEAPIESALELGGNYPHYIGQRGSGVYRVAADGTKGILSPRFDLARHSPDGFEWGYAGSGPAQLALAICADFLRDDRAALELYQGFKDGVIARLHARRWKLTANQVRAGIERVRELRK